MVCKGQLTVHKPASAASSLSLGIPHLFQRLQRRSERDPCFCGEWSLLVCWSLKSHRDLSKLNVKVCCCFIEPGGAIKMKKEASSLHHWSMVNVVNMLFFFKRSLLQINASGFRYKDSLYLWKTYHTSDMLLGIWHTWSHKITASFLRMDVLPSLYKWENCSSWMLGPAIDRCPRRWFCCVIWSFHYMMFPSL